jgi:hypothetical protein
MEWAVKEGGPGWAALWMAGDVDDARKACRRFCFDEPLCVTVTPTTYIYQGGEEAGFVVSLINYPRFPKGPAALFEIMCRLGRALAEELCQMSFCVHSVDAIHWHSRRPEDAANTGEVQP